MRRLCHNCNAPLADYTKFCANCGTQAPMEYQPPSIDNKPNNALAKRIKRRTIIGAIMFLFGVFRCAGGLVGLLILEEPSIFNYSIHGNDYQNALEMYQKAKIIGALQILLYLIEPLTKHRTDQKAQAA